MGAGEIIVYFCSVESNAAMSTIGRPGGGSRNTLRGGGAKKKKNGGGAGMKQAAKKRVGVGALLFTVMVLGSVNARRNADQALIIVRIRAPRMVL